MTLVEFSSPLSLQAASSRPPMDKPSEISMRISCGRDRKASEKLPEISETGRRVAAYLRRLYPDRTSDNVAADTRLKSGTVAKWLEGASAPSGTAMLTLIISYGPDFLGAVLPAAPAWLRADMRSAEAAAALADLERARERLEAVLARP